VRTLGVLALIALGFTLNAHALFAQSSEYLSETDPPTDTYTEDTEVNITTGDASSTLEADTRENTNDTDTTATDAEVHATTTNDAFADTDATTTAATGENEASGTGARVDTGRASSFANVVNVINTNIFNAHGLLYFLNAILGNTVLDLRNLFSILAGGTPEESTCSLETCTNGIADVSIRNTNDAVVTNDVTVGATTGSNTATATDGTATINTGDAYAGANVVNLVNTNITNANYLLMAVNSFANFTGDVVFPGAEWFTDLLAKNHASANTDTTITNTNNALVENAVMVESDTGGNTTSGTNATIATGDAIANTTIVNKVNTNIFGDSLLFLFRIHGSWTGNVFGLPEGMAWRETGDGIELFLAPTVDDPELTYELPTATDTVPISYELPTGTGTTPISTRTSNVTNTNRATVTNNVSVYALTGDNQASGSDGATVTTGDAHAAANIVNVVNTNVLGRNWVLAIFNIFGNWTGNISFGRPDLWVGARAVVPPDVRGGTCFNYEVTVNNLGDGPAQSVALNVTFNPHEQRFSDAASTSASTIRLAIGTLKAHATHAITLPVCLSDTVAGGTDVGTTFTASSTQSDADTANNADVISVVTQKSGGGSALRLSDATMTIDKRANIHTTTASSSVDYTITITNRGGPVYKALLVDILYNDRHEPVHEQRWGLDTIHKNETIIIEYTTVFNASTTPGMYTNEAFVSGVVGHPDMEHNLGKALHSPTASTSVRILPTVATMNEPITVCNPLLTTYIRYGEENDSAEVSKLQAFLSLNEHFDNIALTGTYDEPTYRAVHAFQRRYAADILDPWGVAQTTGYVYYTTQKRINELWCNRMFPLSSAQEKEIATFKTRARTYETDAQPVPEEELREIGMAPTDALPTNTIAEAVVPAPSEMTNPLSVAATQVAGVAGSLDTQATGTWNALRNRVAGFFSWLGL